MSIQVRHQSFADGETLDISDVKRGKGSSANIVRLKFDNLQALKEFQDKLNNLFPENVNVDEKFKEPKEEGLYLTSTGLLLCKDTEGDWSIRAYEEEGDTYTSTSHCNRLGENDDYENDWPKIIKKLGTKAFPLTHVSVTPIYQ